MKKRKLPTRLIHQPGGTCPRTGAVVAPIYQVSTFQQFAPGENQGYDYTRSGNPTRQVLEATIADLEGGSHGFAFASGMAAISASLMVLKSGDHLIATEGLYGGSYRTITQVLQEYGISCSFVDTGNTSDVDKAFRDNTRALFVETPSNPMMREADLSAIANMVEARGALLIVDNTFLTPLLQRPLEEGADIVVHSATKFLAGHSDVLSGLAVTKQEDLAARIGHLQNALGGVPSPFDCWLVQRGIKTLEVRLKKSEATARKIARRLAQHPKVTEIFYPEAGGGILSFRLRDELDSHSFLSHLSLWTLAVSLGAIESIITLPAEMTHLPYSKETREQLGISENLIRLSVGIEDEHDLIEDLEEAFERTSRRDADA